MTISIYILHLLLIHLLIISAVVIVGIPTNFFYRSYQVLLIDPKNCQGELTTLESKA